MAELGNSAVLGALLLPAIKSLLGPNPTVVAGTLGTALALGAFATIDDQPLAIAVSALAGMSWIAVLSSLHVSTQTALPDWIRARGLSFFLTVFFGAMSAGSLIWGHMASCSGITPSLLVAAGGAILTIPLTWRAKLNLGESLDLAPSLHWPAPAVQDAGPGERGPVTIQIAYKVLAENRAPFKKLMQDLRAARRRGGGYNWTPVQNAQTSDIFVETWFEASWIDHLRHHERVSGEDCKLQESIRLLLADQGAPVVKHYLASVQAT